MEASRIESVLAEAERVVAGGESPGPAGFWRVVREVKSNPALTDAYAERIGRIDRAAFKNWALITVPLWLGNVLVVGALLVGLALVGWSYTLAGLRAVVAFYLGFGAVLVATHGLGHLVVGSLLGMRFTHWFVGSLDRPQPGVKVDYSTYLRSPPRARAWMHASGALVTKVMPFAFLGAAFFAGLPAWSLWLLVLLGVGMIVTDVLWSTKSSDWKKFRREMAFAQPSS